MGCLHGYLKHVHFMGQRRHGGINVLLKDDLTILGIKNGCWHQKAVDRSRWMDIWSQCSCDQQDQQINSILCTVCQRSFRHECDKARHKCISERLIQEKAGQCNVLCVSNGSEVEGD